MMEEMFRPIKGFVGIYEISSFGRVKALSIRKLRGRFFRKSPDKILKAPINSSGYRLVCLQHNHNRKYCSVHRLVATAFIPNIENKSQVNHINGVKTDNRVENLEWCTPKENIKHSIDCGLKPNISGENSIKARLVNEDIYFIRSSDLSEKELAIKFNINRSAINKIKRRETWKHLTETNI